MGDFIVPLLLIFGPIVAIWGAWLYVRGWNKSIWLIAAHNATIAAVTLSLIWSSLIVSLYFTVARVAAPPRSPYELILERNLRPVPAALFSPSPVKRDETFEVSLRVV